MYLLWESGHRKILPPFAPQLLPVVTLHDQTALSQGCVSESGLHHYNSVCLTHWYNALWDLLRQPLDLSLKLCLHCCFSLTSSIAFCEHTVAVCLFVQLPWKTCGLHPVLNIARNMHRYVLEYHMFTRVLSKCFLTSSITSHLYPWCTWVQAASASEKEQSEHQDPAFVCL